MNVDVDDDDTLPTMNESVLAELVPSRPPVPLGVAHWAAATSPGLRRRENEDAWGHDVATFVVADGMGGRAGGATAASMAVAQLLRRLADGSGRPDWPAIIHAVNRDVRRAGLDEGLHRLGTTLVAAVVGGPIVTLVHLGDSRAYRYAAAADGRRRLDLLTHDHTVRAELLAAGLDVAEYRQRGVALHGLTSFIGLEPDSLRVDVLAVPVRSGDRILLCTDGVHRQLDDERIRAALDAPTCHDAAHGLVAAADAAGGRDNATALVIEIGATAAPPEAWS